MPVTRFLNFIAGELSEVSTPGCTFVMRKIVKMVQRARTSDTSEIQSSETPEVDSGGVHTPITSTEPNTVNYNIQFNDLSLTGMMIWSILVLYGFFF